MENSSDAKEYTHKKFKKTSVTIPPFDNVVITASTTTSTTTTTALSTASVTETRTTLTQSSVVDGYPSKGTSNDDANKTFAKDVNRNITSPVSTKYVESITVITNSISDPSSRNDQAASISSKCIVDLDPDVKSISNAESSVKETHRQHNVNSQKSFNSILDTDKIIDNKGSVQSNQSSSNISLVNCSLSNDNKRRVNSSSSPHHNDVNNRFGTVSTSSQPIKTEIVNYSQTYEPVTSISSERHPGYPVNISSNIISTQPLIFSYDTSSAYNVRSSSELDAKTVDLTVGSVVSVKEEPVEIKKKPAEVTSQGGKYVCSYCNLPCSKPSVLQKHVRAHTNERPYPCTTCGFSFKTKSNLYKHSRSRSHANRVKGDSNSELNKNKTEMPETVEQNVRATTTVRNEPTQYYGTSATSTNAYNIINLSMSSEINMVDGHKSVISAQGRKPYKPKFQFFSRLDSDGGDNNVDGNEHEESKQTSVSTKLVLSNESLKKGNDKLTQHINDLIKKNQSILDVREPNFLKKRGHHVDTNENRSYTKNQYDSNVSVDEPLNLIARNRKRCMSESEHTQKSLIKELLLRNLTQEQTYVCQFCKISFKNIENFEIHRKNYCKVGENPTSKDIAFVRSHSVNVASILHKNFSKNDENPSRFVRTNLPLKSPGPYLGKTSLISDKGQIPQVFYENKAPTKIHLKALSISHDNLSKPFDRSNTLQEIINSPLKNNNEIIMKPQNIIISEHDSKKHLHEEYKNVYGSNYSAKTQMPVKLFGGEVKITEMSGETRSYKIESKNVCDFSQNNPPFINYGNNLSENMVIKSSLQSGGTLVQNSPSYDKNSFSSYTPKFEANNSPSFQFFNSPSVSKNSVSEHETSRRNYQGEMTRKETPTRFDFNVKPQENMYDQNLIDLGQKAAKIFAPNLKQPNLTLPGLPIPSYNSPKKHYSDNLDQASPSWSLNQNSPLFSPNYMKLRQDLTPSTPDVFSPKPDRTKPNFPEVTSKPLPTVEVTPPSGRPNNIVLSQPSPVGVAAPQSTFNVHGLRLYNPLNLLVNGKLVRYVPGMPGPETGNPIHIGIGGPVLPSPLQIGKPADANETINFSPKVMKTSPVPRENKFNFNIRPENDVGNGESPKRLTPTHIRHPNNLSSVNNSTVKNNDKSRMLSPKKFENEPINFVQSRSPLQQESVEIKTESVIKNFEPAPPRKSLKNIRIYNENSTKTVRNIENVDQISENKAASKIPENDTKEIPKIELDALRKGPEDEKKPMKFLRPNTLAIRPNSSVKTLHGLTPSFLTQDLISPDTPRFAKKYCQLYINGSYFTNLKLKTSTRQTYCTLDMPQPIYWPSYANLSMYTHYKNKRSATDVPDLFRHCYDSRQRSSRYTVAKMNEMITVESSYKSMMETMQKKEETNKCIATTSLPGGYYESNDDYTYIRGRGRGRYVCDQCGIRCKKPSMLKKHIRTHSDVRPYTCLQCNFSFKTKGNLTKHMKSKSHYKRTSTSSSPASDTHTPPRSSTTTDDESDSDVDSDDSIRLQEHEAAHSLLSLAQSRSSQESNPDSSDMASDITIINENKPESSKCDVTMSTSTKVSASENPSRLTNGNLTDPPTPLMYPYIKQTNPTSDNQDPKMETLKSILYYNKIILRVKEFDISKCKPITPIDAATPTKIQFLNDQIENPDLFIANYQQKFISQNEEIASPSVGVIINEIHVPENFVPFADFAHKRKLSFEYSENEPEPKRKMSVVELPDISKLENGNIRKRHVSVDIPNNHTEENFTHKRKISLDIPVICNEKIQRTHRSSVPSNVQGNTFENFSRAMDLSVSKEYVENRNASARNESSAILDLTKKDTGSFSATPVITISMNSGHIAQQKISSDQESAKFVNEQRSEFSNDLKLSIKRKLLNYNKNVQNSQSVSESVPVAVDKNVEEQKVDSAIDLNRIDKINPNETRSDSDSNMSERSVSVNNNLSKLQNAENDVAADMALKREIVEKNKLAQSVASEYLKLVSKNDSQSDSSVGSNGSADAVVKSDSIFNSEENKSCTICFKNFNKPSQLRLHTQIHYFAERKFRCDSCSVSFRTKGHLQKHERSASHHNKLSSTPTTSSSEPRPFKCSDCNIAFRIHGHLAKHLRSKMHIMKLECLARVPFGLYAELERANSLLTEINTTDCDLCLESLKVLARKLFSNDPNKLIQLEHPLSNNLNQDSQEHVVAVQDN